MNCSRDKCTSCKTGFYLDNGICKVCGGDCTECSSADVCTKCNSSVSYLDSNKKCQCLAGFKLDTSSNICKLCSYFYNAGCNSCNNTKCLACNSGYYLKEDSAGHVVMDAKSVVIIMITILVQSVHQVIFSIINSTAISC
jgi:hypothetical protein